MFSGWARGLLGACAALSLAVGPTAAQEAVDPIGALLDASPPPPASAPAAVEPAPPPSEPTPAPPPSAEPSAAAPPLSPPPPAPGEAMPTSPDQSTDDEEAAPDTPQAAVATPPTPPVPPASPAVPAPPPAPVPTTLRPSLSPPVTATPPAVAPPVAAPALAGPQSPPPQVAAPAPYASPGPRPYTPFSSAPPPPPPPPRPQSVRSEPVHIDETNRTPDAPPTSTDLGYEARLRSSFASAQGMQGPLDGRWTLSATGAGDLYVLQLVDTGYGPLEGVWRDVRRPGAIEGSGFLSDLQRAGAGLVFRFYPRSGGGLATATLSQGPDGRWSGELNDGGQTRAVVMRRN